MSVLAHHMSGKRTTQELNAPASLRRNWRIFARVTRKVVISLCAWVGVLILGAVLDQFIPVKAQLFGLVAMLVVACLVVGWGTIAKTKWGVNFAPISCPRCHLPVPSLRRPRSGRQRLWGGSTCSACGTEVDKWGREIPPNS